MASLGLWHGVEVRDKPTKTMNSLKRKGIEMKKEKKAPKSYLNVKRPPIIEAIKLEFADGCEDIDAAMSSLRAKGFFSPPPRPWTVGSSDRGHGRLDYAIFDKFGDVVAFLAPDMDEETAKLIIDSVNERNPSS